MPLNVPQGLFLAQARSDYEIYEHLQGQLECHRLHSLQMSTEKLAKVYAWRHNTPPGRSHFHFVAFLNDLETRPDFHRMFDFKQAAQFDLVKPRVIELARRIESLAPAGNSGPNPEYPWPPNYPNRGPATEPFAEWTDWVTTRAGRSLDYFVITMLLDYQSYFP